jgi:putative endonuclease
MNKSEAVIKAGSPGARSGETFSGECLTGDAKTSPTWYLYLIENKLGQLYTGITTDPKRRIAQHRGEKAGGARALKGKSPLTFRAIFQVSDKSDAAVLECKIKKLTRAQKNQIIQSGKLELNNKGSTLTLSCIKGEIIG